MAWRGGEEKRNEQLMKRPALANAEEIRRAAAHGDVAGISESLMWRRQWRQWPANGAGGGGVANVSY
jgi:hypothetical protein